MRVKVTYTKHLAHNLAHSRCSVNTSDNMPVLLGARVNPYLYPYIFLLPCHQVFPQNLWTVFSQEADMDFFFFFHGRKQSSCIFARVVSVSATGLLIGGANVFPNLR